MKNIAIMCEKFHYDRLRNDTALGSRKSDNNMNPNNNNNNNNNNNSVRIAIGYPFSGTKISGSFLWLTECAGFIKIQYSF